MPRPYIAQEVRDRVAAQAGYRCGYCLTPQSFTAMPLQIEHIVPLAAGGASDEENLWLACPLCNGRKSARTHGIDPESNQTASLFNPRQQNWSHHFAWSQDGILVVGLTPIGRATVESLQLNHEHFLRARRRWVAVGWHPPTLDE
jgi:hypothetical protein